MEHRLAKFSEIWPEWHNVAASIGWHRRYLKTKAVGFSALKVPFCTQTEQTPVKLAVKLQMSHTEGLLTVILK